MANTNGLNGFNIVTIGVLKEGIFPNHTTSDHVIYLYYREDGNLYKYSSIDKKEINLTNYGAYNSVVYIKVGDEPLITKDDIKTYNPVTLEGFSTKWKYTPSKETDRCLSLLIPPIYSLFSVYMWAGGDSSNQYECTNILNLKGVVTDDNGLPYYVYATKSTSLSVNYGDIFDINITAASTFSTDALTTHLNSRNNPHEVTATQIGLGNVDDTRDVDKPVSRAQQEFINEHTQYAESTFARKQIVSDLENAFGSHVVDTNPHNISKVTIGLGKVDNTRDSEKPISKATQKALDAINSKFTGIPSSNDFEAFENTLQGHMEDRDNPHGVTAAQLGLSELSRIFFRQIGYKDEVIDLYIRRGTEEELALIPVINRQLLFATDTRTIYFDHCNIREAYAGGYGIEIVADADANDLINVPAYYLVGTKTNVPDELKDSDRAYILLISEEKVEQIEDVNDPTCITKTSIVTQTIIIGNKTWTRKQNLDKTWTEWESLDVDNVVEDLEQTKQDSIDENLNTVDKSIVGAINEILKLLRDDYVLSYDVREIKMVSRLPQLMKPGVLYVAFENDYLGVDYMRIKGSDEERDPAVHYFIVT